MPLGKPACPALHAVSDLRAIAWILPACIAFPASPAGDSTDGASNPDAETLCWPGVAECPWTGDPGSE